MHIYLGCGFNARPLEPDAIGRPSSPLPPRNQELPSQKAKGSELLQSLPLCFPRKIASVLTHTHCGERGGWGVYNMAGKPARGIKATGVPRRSQTVGDQRGCRSGMLKVSGEYLML